MKTHPDRLNTYSTVGLIALAVGFWLAQVHALPVSPILEPDSQSYLKFLPIRSAGYPLFLQFFGPERAMYVQSTLFVSAALYLSFEVRKSADTAWLALILIVLILSNKELNSYHAQIMTESLFTSLEMIFLGLCIRFLRAPRYAIALLIGVVLGLSAAIRPSAYAYLPILACLVLYASSKLVLKDRLALLITAVLPAVMTIGVERAFTQSQHGAQATSLAGRHLYAKAALINTAHQETTTAMDAAEGTLRDAIQTDFAPVRRLIEDAPDYASTAFLTLIYEVCIEYACSDHLRSRLHSQSGMSTAEIDRTMMKVAVDRVSVAPIDYMELSLRHYFRLLSGTNPPVFSTYQDFISHHRPLPFEPFATLANPPIKSGVHIRPGPTKIRLSLPASITFLLALTGFVCLVIRYTPNSMLAMSFIAALLVHASFTLTALVGVGESRYVTGMWPAMMTSIVFAGGALCVWLREKNPAIQNKKRK